MIRKKLKVDGWSKNSQEKEDKEEKKKKTNKNRVTNIEVTEKIVRNTNFSMRFLHTNT